MIAGVDYSFSRPDPAALKAAGVRFAARYLSGGSSAKDLTAAELKTLTEHGIPVVLVWETSGGRAKAGKTGGQADAKAAHDQATQLGLAHAPIYFAVDFDAQGPDLTAAVDYIRGAASVLGAARVGVYGGLRVVNACHDAGVCAWFWQTLAWSKVGGVTEWSPVAHIRQTGSTKIGGVAVDTNLATRTVFGQWPSPHARPVVHWSAMGWGKRNLQIMRVQRALLRLVGRDPSHATGKWTAYTSWLWLRARRRSKLHGPALLAWLGHREGFDTAP